MTEPFAQKTIRRFGLSSRIGFQAGDYLHDAVQGTYDVAWLSQILHSMGPEHCRVVIEKAVAVLEPGGLILVHDFLLNGSRQPALSCAFALNMLVNTDEGRSCRKEKSGRWRRQGWQHSAPTFRATDSGILSRTVGTDPLPTLTSADALPEECAWGGL
jgi:hypothetical protein